ncbi:MAG TPA: aminotransferase class V-fold PLP-dependent enzyme, partial [Aestuariivirgaceae bacterium]|nr:aminotransferase class V-fold PLP-dependent enzyme [Aestuariivirgaceae bacterium]
MSALSIAQPELEALLSEAHELVARYWSSLEQRDSFPKTSGAQTTDLFGRSWEEKGRGRSVLRDFELISQHARPSNGRFFGYVLGSGEPVGAIGELFAAALNQNVTAWRSAPAAVSIERTVVGWLADAIGCPGMSGSLCGGGSAANLMALAMAREAKLEVNETGAPRGVVYASTEVHMAIPKAMSLLGLGRNNLRLIPTDQDFCMRLDVLERSIENDLARGDVPVAIVASAGTVATGAIDPLEQIARIARSRDLWMHVDGAYGALASIAVPELFHGLSQADSIALDAHKWLYQPLECGCLLFRDRSVARRTFSQSGDYVKVMSSDPTEGFAFFDETMELSRRFRALKLWLSLQYHGRSAFREAIGQDLRNAQLLAGLIAATPELELLANVPLSAVCFRHRSKDNEALLKRVVANGRVYISNALINGQFALRACFVNHRTKEADV